MEEPMNPETNENQNNQTITVPQASIRYIADGKSWLSEIANYSFVDMVPVHVAIENFFDNCKSEIHKEIENNYRKKKDEQIKKLENENTQLKESISDAITEIMSLKKVKDELEKELLKSYTNNVNMETNYEKLKKDAEKLASIVFAHTGAVPEGMQYLLPGTLFQANSSDDQTLNGNALSTAEIKKEVLE
uniref:Conjugal transfer protein n=2 Tax=Caenorhabditis tropicalis TaxID=1561998 RepID=A0A1I7TLT0_9PELO